MRDKNTRILNCLDKPLFQDKHIKYMLKKMTQTLFSITSQRILQNKSIRGVFGTKTGIGKRRIKYSGKEKMQKLSSVEYVFYTQN